ncbi:MAG: hypothetical protein ABI760_13325 [Ferruginibacter sp.]
MKKLYCFLISILLFGESVVQAQKTKTTNQEILFMKVKTDHQIYKGRLYYVSDSSIRFVKKRNYLDLPKRLEIKDIQQISFRRRNAFIRSIFRGLAIGAFLGMLIPAKLHGTGMHVSDKVLLYSGIVGAGAGLIGGAFSAKIIKIDIPINKSQQLFEEKKMKLREFSVY